MWLERRDDFAGRNSLRIAVSKEVAMPWAKSLASSICAMDFTMQAIWQIPNESCSNL
jgi:hypothetical protein